MVPVLDSKNKPLMPCSEKRAALLMDRKQAKPYWQKGIFCIKLLKEPSSREYQDVVLGVDPGSKREAYTAATKNAVILNITTDTKYWIKKHIEFRKMLRITRRQRKTPYRKQRLNRAVLRKRQIPPSTKARWDTKISMIKSLLKIIPINIINVEDISATSRPGQRKWNKSFSPLQVGKNYFYNEINKLNILLIKTSGYSTYNYRKFRGFKKSTKKLNYTWETHCVDSHTLCEMILFKEVPVFKGLYQINFLEYRRRQIHVANPIKNNKRRRNGGTISLGIPRGSMVFYKNKIYYIGGYINNKVSIHEVKNKNRFNKHIKLNSIKILYNSNRRVQYLKL